tara:strand:- start:661 stop:1755 length:1095 start_codon:yes stop_codon:yes gene_type:complete
MSNFALILIFHLQRMALIATTTTYEHPGVEAADIAIEAATERMAVKQTIFRSLDAACKPSAVLCTNTSTLDIDAIAAATSRPSQVCGTHFFSPANVMPLLENVRGTCSSAETLATAMKLGKILGKKTVMAGNAFGFIGNRMVESYLREANYMLEEGALPADVDAPLRAFGMPMGPLQMSDLAGNDIGYSIRKDFGWDDPATTPVPNERYYGALADKLVEMGRLGQKAKMGWYDYSKGRAPVDDPAVEALIIAHSAEVGFERRAFGAQEILDRCLLPLINEGYKCIEEGIAQRAEDVDVVYLYGYGFPRTKGGPIHWSKHYDGGEGKKMGLPYIADALQRYGEAHPNVSHWEPSQLLLDEARKAA